MLLSSKNNPEGGLYAGGWSRGVRVDGYCVIDLTGDHYNNKRGTEIKTYDTPSKERFKNLFHELTVNKNPKAWLSFPIKDFSVPDYDTETWYALACDIRNMMDEGEKVVLVCVGGHGRTGLAASIICWMLAPKTVGNNPVLWVREKHCRKAVETIGQVDYVFEILERVGLPQDEKLKTKGTKTGYGEGGAYSGGVYSSGYHGEGGYHSYSYEKDKKETDTALTAPVKIWSEAQQKIIEARWNEEAQKFIEVKGETSADAVIEAMHKDFNDATSLM